MKVRFEKLEGISFVKNKEERDLGEIIVCMRVSKWEKYFGMFEI